MPVDPFSLLGGPLHRLGQRFGLVRSGTNTVQLGLLIAWPLWAVLMALALIEGVDPLSPEAISAHTRLLLAIPLMFVCETWFDPRLKEFLRAITRSAVVPASAQPALQTMLARTARWSNAWLPEALLLLGSAGLMWLLPLLQIPGTVHFDSGAAAADASLTGWWYSTVCLTALRFLLLRWVWRLCLWFHVLWSLSRLPLQLVASHPDGVAGLGNLELAHEQFVPLVLAVSVVLAASFAVDISAGSMPLEAVYPGVLVVLLIDALVFIAPLFLFAPMLWSCRVKALSDYMEFAERYVVEFEAKWLRTTTPPGEPLLGTPDIQSLADLGNGVDRIRHMRVVPVSLRLLTQMVIAVLMPMLPLALFKYPFAELAQQIFTRLTGL